MAKTILCVIRVSTIRQEIESQHKEMLDFLRDKGYNEDNIEWLEAKGASARTANKAYLEMLETIKTIILSTPTIKCCAVWHLNRLGRLGKYLDEMKNWFIDNHIQLLCKNPEITLLDNEGNYNVGNNIIFSVFAATIPSETTEMMEKFKRGKARNKEQGLYNGGFIPFGFHKVDHRVVVDDSQMELVRLIFNEYATGKYSYYSLTTELQSRGLNFTIRHLHLLLTKDIYKEYVGEELWNKCQEVREGKTLKTKESKYCHLANKLIKCLHCGQTYIADTDSYVCLYKRQGKRYGVSCKDSVSIKVEVLDTILWDLASFYYRDWLANKGKESIDDYRNQLQILKGKIQLLIDEIPNIDKKKGRINELYIDGAIDRETYKNKIAQCDQEVDKINSQIQSLYNEQNRIERLIERLGNNSFDDYVILMSSVGEITQQEQMREIVRQFIKVVYVDKCEYNNRVCTLIIVNTTDDITHQFIFDYNADKRWHKTTFIKKLYKIKPNGEIEKYSLSGKSYSQIFREAFETAKRLNEQ